MKKKGGSHLNSPNELKQKYSSNAAQMYREQVLTSICGCIQWRVLCDQVLRDARAYVNSGQKVAVEVAPAPKKIGEGVLATAALHAARCACIIAFDSSAGIFERNRSTTAGVDDFFSKLDGGTSIGRSASQNSLGARTDSNGSVSNMTSPSARRGSADDPAPMKV